MSLSTLLNHSDDLVRLMEAYLDVTRLSPQAWLDSKFNMDRVCVVEVQRGLGMCCLSSTWIGYVLLQFNMDCVCVVEVQMNWVCVAEVHHGSGMC